MASVFYDQRYADGGDRRCKCKGQAFSASFRFSSRGLLYFNQLLLLSMPPITLGKRKRGTLSEPSSVSESKRQAIVDWVGAITKSSPLPNSQPFIELPKAYGHEDNEIMSQATSQSGSTTISSRVAPDSLDFEPELRRRNIRDADKDDTEPKPANWRQLQELLQQDRASPEIAPDEHKNIRRAMYRARTEASALMSLGPRLLKESWSLERAVSVQSNAPWIRHMPVMPTRTPYLSDPKPDISYGWEVQAFQNIDVGRVLEDYIVDNAKKEKQKKYQGDKKSY